MADIIASSGAAGKVLGPRPGKAACSFKQGVAEIVLRFVNAAVAVLPIVAGVLVLAFTASADSDSSQSLAYAAGVVSLVAGVLVVIWVAIMLILRLLNIGLLNLGSKYFLAVDVIVNVVLSIILVGGGVISIVAAVEWEDGDDSVFGSVIASVITCFVSAVFLVILAVYMIVYIVKGWNTNIVKYTIKEAITG